MENELQRIYNQSMNIFIKILVLSSMLALGLAGCPDHCHDCDPSGTICFACSGDYEANVFGSCHENTIDNCVIYGPTDECFNCQPTFRLNNNKCEKDYTGCVLANSHDGTCFQCGFATILKGTSCSGVINCQTHSDTCTKCRDGYKLESNICKDISKGCAEVRPKDGICSKCKKGFVYSGYQCITENISVPRCYVYSTEGKCKVCKNGFNLFQDKCLLSKQIQKFLVAKEAGTHETFGFTEEGFVEGGKKTQSAVDDFGDFGFENDFGFGENDDFGFGSEGGNNDFGFGEGDFGFGNEPKEEVVVENCQVPDTANPGACLICNYGYFPKNFKCEKVSPLCDGHNVQTGECFGCKFNLKFENGVCSDENCLQSVNGVCVNCKTYFKKDQNDICRYSDPNCLESFNSRCEKCKDSYYANMEGKCSPLPPNCRFANFQTGDCLECKENYEPAGGRCNQIIKIENCQVPDPGNKRNCLICVFGYFPKNSKCEMVSKLCKDHNVQTGDCLSCKNPELRVNNGKCKDPNCQTYDDEKCIKCKQNFVYDQNKEICIFSDPNCEKSGNGACLVCRNGFYINKNMLCSPLPPNCQAASPTGVCSRCNYGFSLSNGACIRQVNIPNCQKPDHANNRCIICNQRYYTFGNTCSPVQQNCNKYDPTNGNCFLCYDGYDVQNYRCVPKPQITTPTPTPTPTPTTPTPTVPQSTSHPTDDHEQSSDRNCLKSVNDRCITCSKRYYPNRQGKCVPVNPLCKDNNDKGQCTDCYKGYSVQSGRCTIAVTTDTNCKTFEGGICKQCYRGFFYHAQSRLCKRINPLCKSSNSNNGACTSCYPGYNLNAGSGNCEVFFKDPNCKKFNGNLCTDCATRYYINNIGKCSPVSPLCKDYDQNTGQCTTCYPGYIPNQGTCMLGNAKDPNCKQFEDGQCQECYNGFYLIGGKCKQANPLCKTFNKENGSCTSCFYGYVISGDTCKQGQQKDPNCKQSSPANDRYCVECYRGFLALNGGCQQQNPLCKTVDMSNGYCKDCWNGYSLVDGNCIVQKQVKVSSTPDGIVDIYCIKVVNGVCEECSNGYYYNRSERICKQVDPICKDYNRQNGFCTDCYQGFTLQAGKCVTARVVSIPHCVSISLGGQCTECLQNYYLSYNKCKPVSILCATYDRSNGKCTSCVTGHFMQEGQCIFPALYDARCIWYESAYCTKCESGYYVESYMCNPINRDCISFDYDSNTCERCANGKIPSRSQCI